MSEPMTAGPGSIGDLRQSAKTSLAIADDMTRGTVTAFKQARMAAGQFRRLAERIEQENATLTRLAKAVVEGYDKPGVTLVCSAIEQLRAYLAEQEEPHAD